MSDAITLQGVAKRFDRGGAALEDINARLAMGEFVAVLGPSGCGKSTLLRLVAGLEQPSAGTVHVDRGGPMSYVFQDATLMPWASLLDNVALPLRIGGLAPGAARERALAALDAVGLGARAAAFPAEVSGGMKMRVSIARALVTGPAVLLLDEPFGALDEITRQRLNDDLRLLWRKASPTAVFVTHSVLEAVYLSTRVLVMGGRPGRVMADIAVDLPADRQASLRLEPRFQQQCRVVSEALARGGLVPERA